MVRFRVIVKAPGDYIVVIMLNPYSIFAHEVFRGGMTELCEFLTDLPIQAY